MKLKTRFTQCAATPHPSVLPLPTLSRVEVQDYGFGNFVDDVGPLFIICATKRPRGVREGGSQVGGVSLPGGGHGRMAGELFANRAIKHVSHSQQTRPAKRANCQTAKQATQPSRGQARHSPQVAGKLHSPTKQLKLTLSAKLFSRLSAVHSPLKALTCRLP